MRSELGARVESAAATIRDLSDGFKPEVGVVLGTGLGALEREIENAVSIPYGEVDELDLPSATGGRIVYGSLGGKRIVAFEGLFHAYEGLPLSTVTLPVRIVERLGARALVLTSAAGALAPDLEPGDLLLVDDHLNFLGSNPLVGAQDDGLGPLFPDMTRPYDEGLLELAERAAARRGTRARRGVYAAVLGPSLETRAERRFLRSAGADAVGMSGVAEAIVGVQCGLRVLSVSCLTDRSDPDARDPIDLDAVVEVAMRAEPLMTRLVVDTLAAAGFARMEVS